MKNELLAPNGKPSNLNATQYKLVRTPAFKKWFGDWENDSANSSKVVDENGEPLIVYHGSSFNFYKFDRKKIGLNYIQSEQGGFFFTQKKQSAENYAKLHSELKSKGFVYECFLNIKNPLIRRTNSDYWNPADNYDINRMDYIRELFINENLDGIIIFGTRNDNLYVVSNSNQIKLADGTNTGFDSANDDIRFEKGGLIAPNGKSSNLNAEQYKLVRTPAFKKWFGDWENDPANSSKVVDRNGEPLIVYHGTNSDFTKFSLEKVGSNVDYGMWGSGFYFSPLKSFSKHYGSKLLKLFLNIRNPFVRNPSIQGSKSQFKPVYGKDESIELRNKILNSNYDGVLQFESGEKNPLTQIVAFEPNQIKLADGTNTVFDSSNTDIRFEQGGEINEEAQQLIDIISMNPKLEKYQKYKVLLKDKFGIDFDLIYKDQEYIDNANLIVIKSKDDFFDFGNWLRYAKIISTKRGFVPMDSYATIRGGFDEITDQTWNETAKKLDFIVQKVEYEERGTGSGDIARAFGDTIVYTKEADLYYFLHEIGHIYDFQNVLTGIIKNPAYSPTNYGTTHSGETFAENFAIYFLNPTALKNWNEDVYYAMDSAINDKYKKELKKIVSEKSKFENGGELKAENMLKHPLTIKRLKDLDDNNGFWVKQYHAKTNNYKPNTYYHLNTNGLNAGVGKGLYLGRDKDALISFYDLDSENKKVDTYVGNPNWLDLIDYADYNRYEQEAIEKYGKNQVSKSTILDLDSRGEMLRKLTIEKGFDGIRYYDPQATGEEFVLFNVKKVKKIDSNNKFDMGGKIDWESTNSINIKINNDLYRVQYQRGERGDTDKKVWFAKVISKNNKEVVGRLCEDPELASEIYGFSLKEVESGIWESYINNELYLIIEDDYGNEKEIIHIQFSDTDKLYNGGLTDLQILTKRQDIVNYLTKNSGRWYQRDLDELNELFDSNTYVEQDDIIVKDLSEQYINFYKKNPNFKKIPLIIYEKKVVRNFGEGELFRYDFVNEVVISSSKKDYNDFKNLKTIPINDICGFIAEKYENKIYGALMHEYGHLVNISNAGYINDIWFNDNYEQIVKNISIYAGEKKSEFLAEVFTLINIPNFDELYEEKKEFIIKNYYNLIPAEKLKYEKGGITISNTPDYLEMFLGK